MVTNPLNQLQEINQPDILGGRYKIISELGEGGFGHTFLAEDMHMPGHACCVVKQLKPKNIDAESLQTARRLFNTEAEALYQLGNHDQIPRLLAHFEENQEFYLAQELIEGEQLSEELVLGQPWSESKVIALLLDILQILTFVHQKGVIHRDIKPSNLIRRRQDNRIVLIDFGAVKQVRDVANFQVGQTDLTIAIGTKGYMPNEQLAGTPQFSSDIYAIGMIGIQALTGVKPRNLGVDPRTSEINWHKALGNLPNEYCQPSSELTSILDRMVLYDFRERYQTALEAWEALKKIAESALEKTTDNPYLSKESLVLSQPIEISTGTTEPLEEVQPVEDLQQLQANAAQTAPTPKEQLTQQPSANRPPIFSILASVVITFLITFSVIYKFAPPFVYRTLEYILDQDNNSSTPGHPEESTSKTIEPETAELLSKADSLRREEKYLEAIATYNQVIAVNANIAEAYWGRCYSLNELKRSEEALINCDKAIALKPNYPEAYSSKGNALEQQGKHKEALESLDKALNIKGNSTEAWSNRGVALMSLKRPQEALIAFSAAINLQPAHVEAWANRGAALWALERYDEAVESIDKALELQPDHLQALNLRQQADQLEPHILTNERQVKTSD
ncbi:MAG: serine/threonine-protein kinase [Coleofasciculaceae cyanobacterium]